MTEKNPIYVTQPFLPPLEEFIPYLEEIWESKWLTNNGPFHQKLEQELCKYLGVEHISLFVNGTIALVIALQALRITGEVITTPYSFVATSHSLVWNNIQPIFVDIDPATCNLDPNKIEPAITSQTTAIMPVHCYGNPCDVESIQQVADTFGLKIIYDAAHAFGVRYKGESLLNYGDLSVLSFHATKPFNTFEGGAIVCPDAKTKQQIDYLKNFGFADEVTVKAIGINGKMNEFQAAMGLLQLKHIDKVVESRQYIDTYYRETLANMEGIHCLNEPIDTQRNYAYFPIIVDSKFPLTRDALYQKMRDHKIFCRRYFFPLISDMPMYRKFLLDQQVDLSVASTMSDHVICLPLYQGLSNEKLSLITDIIFSCVESHTDGN